MAAYLASNQGVIVRVYSAAPNEKERMKENPLMIALDYVPDYALLNFIKATSPFVAGFKFNHKNINSLTNIVPLTDSLVGVQVIADFKLFDTPFTNLDIAHYARKKYANYITVHCANGPQSLKHLSENIDGIELIGITLLTSSSSYNTFAVFGKSRTYMINDLVDIGTEAGINKFVSSPENVVDIKRFNSNAIVYCPGIVIGDIENSGHQTPQSPKQAMDSGADFIIVGRGITQSLNPLKTIENIHKEIEKVYV